MTILECLDDEIFSLPKSIGKDGMIKCLEYTFEKYRETLDLITDDALCRELKLHKSNIRALCESFISSYSFYQKGFIKQAYSEFEKSMEILKPFLFPEKAGLIVESRAFHKPFYRARIGTNIPFPKPGMFHLPFSMRELANTQRFSVPGLPCLYLSNSIYVCWEELNRPPLSTFQVSRFQQENFNLKILDISLTPTMFKQYYKSHNEGEYQGKQRSEQIALKFLFTWPLSFICSLRVGNEKAPFKQEYVFPQFILQWVTYERNVDGIKYFSVKANPFDKEDFSNFTNYVFPPKKMELEDYCSHLKQSFKLSESFSAELFEIADPNFIFISKEWLENVKYKVMHDIILLELIKGQKMPYAHTLFGKMELLIQNLEVDFLSDNC